MSGEEFRRCCASHNRLPPLIFDLEAEQDTDHVVAIFKVRGHWGAVAKSNFTGCRYREPVTALCASWP